MVDDSGVELMCVGEVKVETVAMFEPLWAQRTLVEAGCTMEEEVELEVTVTECDE